MNRRKAIYSFLGIGAFVVAGTTFYKFFKIFREPNLDYLDGYKGLIAEIADTIIPTTDTPGAKDLKIEDQILLLIRDCTDKRVQNNIIYGLDALIDFTHTEYGRTFEQCSQEERIAILTYFEERESMGRLVGKIMSKIGGDKFIAALKKCTAFSYCTSEKGATMGLAYLPVPGVYKGCFPLEKDQKSWATK